MSRICLRDLLGYKYAVKVDRILASVASGSTPGRESTLPRGGSRGILRQAG